MRWKSTADFDPSGIEGVSAGVGAEMIGCPGFYMKMNIFLLCLKCVTGESELE